MFREAKAERSNRASALRRIDSADLTSPQFVNGMLSSYALARAYGRPATLASVTHGARRVFAELRKRRIPARGARLSSVVALAWRSAPDWTDNGRLVWCF